ncbi:hypothetical protein D8T45_23365, partial [Vibrio vulnificus]
PFVLSEVRVSHVFYFLAGAKFMIIASHCFYVQRCRTSYLNPSLFFGAKNSENCLNQFSGKREVRAVGSIKTLNLGF